MKNIIILLFFIFHSNFSYAELCRGSFKNLYPKTVEDSTINSFSNSGIRILSDSSDFKIVDSFDQRGSAYRGLRVVYENQSIPDDRNFITKFFFPKIDSKVYYTEIDLYDSAIKEDVQGLNELTITCIYKYKGKKGRFDIVFSRDLSDNCRPH